MAEWVTTHDRLLVVSESDRLCISKRKDHVIQLAHGPYAIPEHNGVEEDRSG